MEITNPFYKNGYPLYADVLELMNNVYKAKQITKVEFADLYYGEVCMYTHEELEQDVTNEKTIAYFCENYIKKSAKHVKYFLISDVDVIKKHAPHLRYEIPVDGSANNKQNGYYFLVLFVLSDDEKYIVDCWDKPDYDTDFTDNYKKLIPSGTLHI